MRGTQAGPPASRSRPGTRDGSGLLHEIIWMVGVFFEPLRFFLHRFLNFENGSRFCLILQEKQNVCFLTQLNNPLIPLSREECILWKNNKSTAFVFYEIYFHPLRGTKQEERVLCHAIHPSDVWVRVRVKELDLYKCLQTLVCSSHRQTIQHSTTLTSKASL